MAETDPTILSGILDGMRPFLAARDIELDGLLRQSDLTPELLEEPSNPLPLDAVAALFEHAARQSNDKLFGMHFAQSFKPGATGIVGYLVLHAPTLGKAVEGLSRYVRLLVTPIDMQFDEGDGVGCLNWTYPAGFKGPWAQFSLCAISLLVLRIRRAAGPDWRPMRVEFEHRLETEAECADLLGEDLLFNRSRSAIWFHANALNNPMPDADDTLYRVVRELGDRLLADNPHRDDVVARTRHAITNMLSERLSDDEAPELETVAEKLQMARRLLRSRLGDAGTSFSKVLDDTRRDLADRYLRDTDLQMTDIAFMLGFSQLSVFTRASVQRWFGMSPSAYRHYLRDKPRD